MLSARLWAYSTHRIIKLLRQSVDDLIHRSVLPLHVCMNSGSESKWLNAFGTTLICAERLPIFYENQWKVKVIPFSLAQWRQELCNLYFDFIC